MNAAIVARTLSLIPDRVARVQSGSAFDASAPARCAHPERIAHLVRFLGWLAPLHAISRDDLRVLGFMTPYAKLDLEPEPLTTEAEEEAPQPEDAFS